MKAILITGLLIAAAMTSCNGNNKSSTDEAVSDSIVQDEESVDLTGQWFIENIVLDDSTNVCPVKEVPGSRQYFMFTDSTYNIMTNCNSFCGPLTQKGDSIRLGDGMMTEIACDNMATEDALRKILPQIVAIDVENDSIIRLNTDRHSQYILLHKAKDEVK